MNMMYNRLPRLLHCALSMLVWAAAAVSVSAQTSASMSTRTNGGDDLPDHDGGNLPDQFTRYQLNAFQEKVFVHTDKDFYLAGETLWFKVYEVDACFNRPMPFSGIAYIELIGNDHQPVLRAKIRVKDGSGAGSWTLPAGIASGNYLLRAYTSWMKNFSPDFYFHQTVTIVNTLNGSGVDTLHSVAGYDMQFFPEGGHLVEGLPSRVAFKAVNPDGDGIACAGVVLDQKKDTVVRWQSNRWGMGSFVFTPQKGDRYTTLVTPAATPAAPLTVNFPSVDPQGYTLQLDNGEKDRIKILVRSNLGQQDRQVYLFTHTRHLFKNFQTGYLTNGAVVFFIDRKNLGDGISHITLFNGAKMPVCERLYFKMPENTLHIDVSNLLAGYTTRQKIDLSLLTTDASGHPVAGDLSMSVFLLDSLQSIPRQNILTYLLLTSDLRGKIECPSCYFTDPATPADLDDLLLTQGWTRFRWDNILNGNGKPNFEFLPETNGPVISGKIINRRTGLPVPSVIGYLSVPGRYFEFSAAMSRPDGSLFFHAGNWTGSKEMIVQTNSRTDSNYRVDIGNPFSDKFSSYPLPGLSLSQKWESLLTGRSIGVQVENTYRIREKHPLPAPSFDTASFYGRPDLQYLLEDYTKFATLEEVMKEYVSDVRLRRQSDKFYYRVRDSRINLFFEDDPLLLLDGVPVFDVDKLMKLDPAKMKKIDVLTRKYYIGPLQNDGIISYRSVDGDLAGYTLDPDAVVLEYNGLQQQREFYTPVYSSKARVESRVPDLRNQLQWSPAIRTGAEGSSTLSINTSDRVGRYALVIQGTGGNGLAGATVLTFTVTK